MKLGLINSAWVQTGQPTSYGLRKTKEIGFDTIDLFVDALDIDVRERRLIKDECDRLELPIVSLTSSDRRSTATHLPRGRESRSW